MGAFDDDDDDEYTDPFAPPAIPTEVYCLHCEQTYDSWRIEWRERRGGLSPDRNGRGEGDWCCPTPGCNGLGFCFDLWPTDPEWRDENGEPVNVGDDEGWDGDDVPDEDFDWVPVEPRPLTPQEQEEFDRFCENSRGHSGTDCPPRRPIEPFDEDDF
jgi:hypothetical protein